MCIGGGNNRATREAERQERNRTAEIERGNRLIDQSFAGRQPQYDEFLNALRDTYRTDAERQKGIADRQLRFSSARGGLTGGSFAADAGENLADEFSRGILQAERRAQGALSGLQQQDESTRMNLMQMLQGGMNATTAAQRAASAMRTNLAGAQSQGQADSLGDIFGGTADLYRRQQEAASRRRGLSEAEHYANPFSRRHG